jgi:hypothetical protein
MILGKYYFTKGYLTEFRTVCDSPDCERLLGSVEVGRLSGSDLDDVKTGWFAFGCHAKGYDLSIQD